MRSRNTLLLHNIFLYKIQPLLLIYLTIIIDMTTNSILTSGTFWKVANYADSYWFTYSNKKSIYEVITQNNVFK